MPKAMTSEQAALCNKLGWDPANLDWTKIVQVIQLLIQIFGTGPSPVFGKAKAGCEDHCEGCLKAAGLALQSAQTSMECAGGMCEPTA